MVSVDRGTDALGSDLNDTGAFWAVAQVNNILQLPEPINISLVAVGHCGDLCLAGLNLRLSTFNLTFNTVMLSRSACRGLAPARSLAATPPGHFPLLTQAATIRFKDRYPDFQIAQGAIRASSISSMVE